MKDGFIKPNSRFSHGQMGAIAVRPSQEVVPQRFRFVSGTVVSAFVARPFPFEEDS